MFYHNPLSFMLQHQRFYLPSFSTPICKFACKAIFNMGWFEQAPNKPFKYASLIFKFFCFCFLPPLFFASSDPYHPMPLKLLQTIIVEIPENLKYPHLSGLTTDGTNLYTVSDRADHGRIYKIEFQKNKALLKPHIEFEKVILDSLDTKERGLDLEGITWCSDKFFLANERERNLIWVSFSNQGIIRLPWESFHAQDSIMNPFSSIKNAGLEAIACDPENQVLFLFNERQFRMGYTFSILSGEFLNQFDYASATLNPRLITVTKKTPHSLPKVIRTWIHDDFSGSDFYQGWLYILERSNRRVVRFNPKTLKASAHYSFSDYGLYEDEEPFGMAEGLAIFNGKIYIVLDNNFLARKGTTDDFRATLLVFELP